MDVMFFESPAKWREWLEANHATESEVIVGYFRAGVAKPGMSWKESVDEALCFGWIDGVRRKLDDESYCNRFTPRKAKSNWSEINIARVGELIAEGRMRPAGLAAFEKREAVRTGVYSYENRPADLPGHFLARLQANEVAAAYWAKLTPSMRRTLTWWVVSAKQEATQERRFATLMASAQGGELPAAARGGS